MANTLTNLYPKIFAALNVVSREMTGMVPAVSRSASIERVAKGQSIIAPVAPKATSAPIVPSNVAPTGSDRDVGNVTLTVDNSEVHSFHLTGEEELGLSVAGTNDDLMTQSFLEAFRTLANKIEKELCDRYVGASRAYGTAGTTPFGTKDDLSDIAQVRRILDQNGAPPSGRSLVLNDAASANLRGKQPSVFRVNEDGTPMGRRMGAVGMLLNFDLGESVQFTEHDASGTISGVAINKGAGEPVGATDLTVDGGGAGEILNAGDVVTLAGDTNKYVAKAMAASAATLSIQNPGLREAAADNAAITAVGDYTPSLAFSRDAIVLGVRLPAIPEGGDAADDRTTVIDPVSGLPFDIAVYRQFHQVTYTVGIAWGSSVIKPAHLAILLG